jgi:hypothetical protein
MLASWQFIAFLWKLMTLAWPWHAFFAYEIAFALACLGAIGSNANAMTI